MAAKASVVHRIPGRVRLVFAEKRGDIAYFSRLSESFAHFHQIRGTRANPITASIALQFSGSLEQVLRQAEQENLLSMSAGWMADARHPLAADPAAPYAMTHSINLVRGRDVNRMFMLGSMLLAAGLLKALRGEFFPPARSVFWYAREAFQLAAKRR